MRLTTDNGLTTKEKVLESTNKIGLVDASISRAANYIVCYFIVI